MAEVGSQFCFAVPICDIFLRKVKGKDCCKKICQRWRRIPRILENPRRHDFVGWSPSLLLCLPRIVASRRFPKPLLSSLSCGLKNRISDMWRQRGRKGIFCFKFVGILFRTRCQPRCGQECENPRRHSSTAPNRNSIFSLKKKEVGNNIASFPIFSHAIKTPTFSLFYFLDPFSDRRRERKALLSHCFLL